MLTILIEEKDKQIVSLTDRRCRQVRSSYFNDRELFGDPENMEINHHVLRGTEGEGT